MLKMEAYIESIKKDGLKLEGKDAEYLLVFLTARLAMFGQASINAYVKFGTARTKDPNKVKEEDIASMFQTVDSLVNKRKKSGRPLFAKQIEQVFYASTSQHLAYLHTVRKVFPGWDKAIDEGARAAKDGRGQADSVGAAQGQTPQTEQQPQESAGLNQAPSV
jgi:hypothetical protein